MFFVEFCRVLIVRSSKGSDKNLPCATSDNGTLAITPELCGKLAGGDSQENGDGSC